MPRTRKNLNPDRHATVSLTGLEWGNAPMTRAALFVYRTKRGFGWVEPGYLDPLGSPSPQDHEWEGKVVQGAEGFTCEGERGRASVQDIDVADGRSGIYAWARGAFEEARRLIEAKGRTLDEERVWVRKILGEFFN